MRPPWFGTVKSRVLCRREGIDEEIHGAVKTVGEARLDGGNYGKIAFQARQLTNSGYRTAAEGKPLHWRCNSGMIAMDLKAIRDMSD